MRKCTFAFLFALLGLSASAQKLSIQKMEFVNDVLVVSYNIEDSNPNNEYLVTLFSSKDNFTGALVKVKGDIGQEVRPGQRKVEWNVRDEYGNFKGPLAVELRASVFVPFARLKTFEATRRYKRGKAYPLEWRPGNTNPIHIELFKGTQRLQGELNHPNSGTYSINFPTALKPGRDYRIKFTDSKHAEDFLYTNNFKVVRKFPLLLKALPVAIGGFFLIRAFTGPVEEGGLPNPPKTPPDEN
jgi:hypothetical protein